jgi:hypothetical protein
MEKMTERQRSKIYGVAKEKGIDSEDLHARVWSLTRKESIAKLTKAEASRVIDSLVKTMRAADIPPGAATDAQKAKIYMCAKAAGWTDESNKIDFKRLNGFIKRTAGVEFIGWLTVSGASKVIDGLEAINKRKAVNG